MAGRAHEVTVRQEGTAEEPLLHAEVAGGLPPAERASLRAALRRLLGTDVDMAPFMAWAAAVPSRATLATRFAGMRPPRTPSVFETLAFAICCQQLSLARGLELVQKLMIEAGTPRFDGDPHPTFPAPTAVAAVPAERGVELSFSRMKARALTESAGKLAIGELELEALADQPDGPAVVLGRGARLRGRDRRPGARTRAVAGPRGDRLGAPAWHPLRHLRRSGRRAGAGGGPGVQLTCMDAKVGDRVVTPRESKCVEGKEPLVDHLGTHRIGSIAEIFDGHAPHAPRGCTAQAWSVAATLRAWTVLSAPWA